MCVFVCVLFTHVGKEGLQTWNGGLVLQELKLASVLRVKRCYTIKNAA
jgi:hypothetical protein